MSHSLTCEILFNQHLADIEFAVFSSQGKIWRVASVNADWRKELANISSSQWVDAELKAQGIHVGDASRPAPPLAVMCCGLGAVWPGMGQALYEEFPIAAAAMDEIAALAGWDLLGMMDEENLDKITRTRWQIPYLFMLEYAQWKLFAALGVKPNIFCGHSLGELLALCFAQVYSLESAWHLLETRSEHMAELESKRGAREGMLAVPADYGEIALILGQWPDLHISNRNTDKQFILGGDREHLLAARKKLRSKKIPAIMLNMNLAFHNPAMRILRSMSMRRLNGLAMNEAKIPVLSCVDAKPYPAEKALICRRIADLDENTVDWVLLIDEVKRRYPDCVFLELGPQEILCGITGEMLPDNLRIPADKKAHEAHAVKSALAQLFALGFLDQDRVALAGRSKKRSTRSRGYARTLKAVPDQADSLGDISEEDFQIVRELVAEAANVQATSITPSLDLRQDLAVRSSHFPFLMLEAERRLGHAVELENLFRIVTVADLARFLTGAPEPASAEATPEASRPFFGAQRQPLRRYAAPDGSRQPAPASLDPAAAPLVKKGTPVYADIQDDEIRPWLLNGLLSYGSRIFLASEESRESPGDAIFLFAGKPVALSDDPASQDAIPAWLASSAIKSIFVVQRFLADENRTDWRKAVGAWHDKLAENLPPGARLRAIAVIEGSAASQNVHELGDWLIMEMLRGHEPLAIWSRLPDRKGAPLFCGASRIFANIFPDPTPPSCPDGSVFRGIRHFSCFADPALCSHGTNALFTPLSQYEPAEPCKISAWLPFGELVGAMREAAHISTPWLVPIAFADIKIARLPSLPFGITRETKISAASRLFLTIEGVRSRIAEIRMELAEISENGRQTGEWRQMAKGLCISGETEPPITSLWDNAPEPQCESLTDYLSMFYHVLGYSPTWQLLKNFAANGPEWTGADFNWPAAGRMDSSSRFRVFSRMIDGAVMGAMASLGDEAASQEELASLLGCWRLSAAGFIRANPGKFDGTFTSPVRFTWHLSWRDAHLTRYDVEGICNNSLLFTIQNLEFEKYEGAKRA